MSDHRRGQREGHRAELVLGFGNLSERSIERGIATIADLLGRT
jgi:DNA-binding transcriptional MocR family regulator